MTAREKAVVPRDPVTGLRLRLISVVSGAAGLACLGLGIYWRWWGSVLTSGFLCGVAAFFHLMHFVRPRADKRVRQELGPDGVRIRVGLRPQRPLALLSGEFSAVMLLAAGVVLDIPVWGQVAAGALAVLGLVVVPDSVRALLVGDRGVVLTPRTLTYRGWSYDFDVLWDEIILVSVDGSNPYLVCIRVDLLSEEVPPATRHRIVLGLEPPPQPAHVKIPWVAVDCPAQLAGLARRLSELPAELRHQHLAAHGLAIMTGTSPEP